MTAADYDPIGEPAETRRAWQTAVASSALIAIGEVGYAIFQIPILGVHPMVDLRGMHVVLILGVLAVLLTRRAVVRYSECVIGFLVAAVPLLPIMWVEETLLSRAHMPWTPFTGFKFVVFPAALLTPGPLYIAALLTSAVGLEAVFAYYALDLQHNKWATPGEPGATIVFTLIALGTILIRLETRRAEREAARVRAEADAFERFATMFLALRDGAGTPLQTLEVGLELLRMQKADPNATIDRMLRALAELRDIHKMVLSCEDYVRQRSEVTSLDAHATLEALEQEFRDFRGRKTPRSKPFFRWRSSA